ncbi:hypothetical protein HYU14_06920 [Candidatus Woesearchaeota archaeon]|nr:hypothetical protein [Candidatus Woesearchaeota archaeon]
MLIESFSGVRGIYGSDLTLEIAKKYGAVFYAHLKETSKREPLLVVGRDTRSHSDAIKDNIILPFSEVIDVGVLPLPAVEQAVRHFRADGGIMVTASHNEPEFNGFKLLDGTGAIVSAKVMKSIIDSAHIRSVATIQSAKHQMIRLRRDEALSAYVALLELILGKEGIEKIRSLPDKILADPNGGAGIALREILDSLAIPNVIIINESAGNFRRKIEPNGASLKYLKRHILRHGCSLGAGFDSDADRVEMLLPDGKLVDGNAVLGLVAGNILANHKGCAIAINDATSQSVRKIAESHGCKVEEVEVGEINVVEAMRRLSSPLGGEGSNGGIIIHPGTCRDGILTLLLVMKIISEEGKNISSLLASLPAFFTKSDTLVFSESPDKGAIRKAVKDHFAEKGFHFQETGDENGGLKIVAGDSTFLWMRFSRTEANTLRLIADSDDEAVCHSLLAELNKLLKK